MTRSAKERLIETAIELFNENGYEKVSLREIAEAAGTTIGNLTYHFHRKEDLLVAIQEKIALDFVNFADDSSETGEKALRELIAIFKKSAELKARNRFFFADLDAIITDNQTLSVSVQDFHQRLYLAYQQCFRKLVKFKMFRQDISDQQYAYLALTLLTMDYACGLRHSPKHGLRLAVDTAVLSVNAIYPYLTERGRTIWERINVMAD